MRVGSYKRTRSIAARHGFTLVELLVVVAILAILGAVAFPVVVKVKQRAYIAECLSNMKQLGSALHMYVDDFGGRFPSAAAMGIPWQMEQKTIQELLTPYVRSGLAPQKMGKGLIYPKKSVFCCPSDIGIPREDDGYMNIRSGVPVYLQTGCSYVYYASNQENYFLRNRPRVPWSGLSPEVRVTPAGEEVIRIGAPEYAVVHPARKATLGDVWFWHLGDTVPPDNDVAYCNTLFVDGHAARVRGAYHVNARIQTLNKHWHSYFETGR